MALRAVSTAVLVAALLFGPGNGVDLASVARFAPSAPRVNVTFNINCGGEANERFLRDDYRWIVGNTSKFFKADAAIGGAEQRNLPMYKSHRYGVGSDPEWGYDVPVKFSGIYECTVHFAETSSNAFRTGARVFDLTIAAKGAPRVFKNIDVFNETNGAQFTALTKTAFNLTVTTGISFRVRKHASSPHAAFMSGITCVRDGPLSLAVIADVSTNKFAAGGPVPAKLEKVIAIGDTLSGNKININAGHGAIGRFRAEDMKWIAFGPTTVFASSNRAIGGADPENVNALWSHRYGTNGSTFGYNIPVNSSGVWECSLHWAEIVSTKNIGDRVFDAQLQDRVYNNVDVMRGTGGARFTSFVETFFDVPIVDSLVVRLYKGRGDPMLSAITCVKSYDTSKEFAAALLAQRTAPVPPSEVSPEPVFSPGADVHISMPSVEPEPSRTPSASGTDSASTLTDPVTVTVPSTMQTPFPEFPSPGPDFPDFPDFPDIGDINATTLLANISADPRPAAGPEEVLQTVELTVTLPADTVINSTLKKVVKNVTATGAETNASMWFMTSINVSAPPAAAPRSIPDAKISLDMDMEAVLPNTVSGKGTVESLTRYIQQSKATRQLQETYPGSDIKLRDVPDTNAFALTEFVPATKTSTIVAAVVGTLLGVLLIVAIAAFFVIHRHRRNEVNPAAFDAPPPAMDHSDAEAQSSTARSETAASVDYLDDDSTFTAATSRAGDPEAGVTLDKDVWGRGSS